MELTAPGKLAAIVVTLLGSFGFIIAAAVSNHAVETTPAWATITLVTGYLIGNGVGAKRGQPTVPVWTPTTTTEIDPAALATALKAVVASGGLDAVLKQMDSAPATPATSPSTDQGD